MERADKTNSVSTSMSAAAYDYALPRELIAQDPPPVRGDSRLLVAERTGLVRGEFAFDDLPRHLEPGDLLIVNDSRVLPARLWTRRADSGGGVQLLLVEPVGEPPDGWLAMARPARRLRAGLRLHLDSVDEPGAQEVTLEVVDCRAAGEVVVRPAEGGDLAAIAGRHGDVPLPPYIRRDRIAPDAACRRQRDRERYQTVYARTDPRGAGSVAAPTAGLHFAAGMPDRLAKRGIAMAVLTLHVGPGTFRAPDPQQVASGRLHAERFNLPATTWAAFAACRARCGRIIAVGTTSLRVLETVQGLCLPAEAAVGVRREYRAPEGTLPPVFTGEAVREAAGWTVTGATRLFIQPPAQVAAVDGLLTNFHLPGSSLLRLVAAFTGGTAWRGLYREAIARRLRFFSYGDAMLLLPERDRAR